jgi:hypothetical protein
VIAMTGYFVLYHLESDIDRIITVIETEIEELIEEIEKLIEILIAELEKLLEWYSSPHVRFTLFLLFELLWEIVNLLR